MVRALNRATMFVATLLLATAVQAQDVIETPDVPPEVQGCGSVTFEGCCGQGVLKYCDGGQLQVVDCKQNPDPDMKICGWQASASYYDCGGAGEDPSGANPYLCDGESCTPSCAGKECGSDGCAGTCGTCGAGTNCKAGKCAAGGCGGITYEGCCEGTVLKYCQDDQIVGGDCAGNEPPNNTCGWAAQFYDCGGKGEDPGGKFPIACPGTPPPDEGPSDLPPESVPDEMPGEMTPADGMVPDEMPGDVMKPDASTDAAVLPDSPAVSDEGSQPGDAASQDVPPVDQDAVTVPDLAFPKDTAASGDTSAQPDQGGTTPSGQGGGSSCTQGTAGSSLPSIILFGLLAVVTFARRRVAA